MDIEFSESLFDQLVDTIHRQGENYLNAVRDFRLIFEQIFKKLTEKEPQVFSNLFQRISYIIDKFNIPQDDALELHGFRKFANGVTHTEGFYVAKRGYLTSIKVICEAIHRFSGNDIPIELIDLYKDTPGLKFERQQKAAVKERGLVKCIVKAKGPVKSLPDNKVEYILKCEAEEDLESFTLVVRSNAFNAFQDLHPLIWNFCTLNLINIHQDLTKEDTYIASDNAQIVIEPDFLVDVSEIAECFQKAGSNYLLFFLGKLVSSEGNEAAFKGKIVNDLLDNKIKSPNKSFDGVYKEAVTDNALKAAKFGQQALDQIKSDILTGHLANLNKAVDFLKNKRVKIEPTFFSSLYGLQGRLDVMAEDTTEENRRDVFELKSGKAPFYDAWPNNKIQVVCYNMLLRSVFGQARTGNTSILYSSASADALRNVTHTKYEEWQVLDIRNHIVYGLLELSQGRFYILKLINQFDIGEFPPFKTKDIEAFEDAFLRSDQLHQSYYEQLLAFYLRELRTAKIGSDFNAGREDNGFSALWQDSLADKEKRYNIITGLKIERFEPENNSLILSRTNSLIHNFRENDTGIIYPLSGDFAEPLKNQIYKGSIKKIGPHQIVFELRNKQLDATYFSQERFWIIEHDLYETNFWSVIQHLLEFLKCERRIKDLVIGNGRPEFEKGTEISDTDLEKKNQLDLLNNAMNAKDYFLIQGPPGTGKTSAMMVSIAKNLLKTKGNKVVILAYTNRAVDEICRKLGLKKVRYLRLGGRDPEDTESLRNQVHGKNAGEIREFVKGYSIFVSTVSGFHNFKNDLMDIVPCNILMIDEASQLTEPQLIGLLPGFSKFILIGDQNQLPAVIVQSEDLCKITQDCLNRAGVVDLRQSLFERLYNRCEEHGWTNAIGMLESHYRMHDDIARLINGYYGGRLVSARQQQIEFNSRFSQHSKDPVEQMLARSRTIFIQSGFSATSKRHQDEAAMVAKILDTIKRKYGQNFNEESVGVVTPWRAQIAQIKSIISDQDILDKVTIDTIERFQGSERDIIIVSLAVYHPSQLRALQSIDLKDTVDRKLLVTVSRAKEHLIILGYDKALEGSRYYRDLLEAIRKYNGLVSYQESLAIFND